MQLKNQWRVDRYWSDFITFHDFPRIGRDQKQLAINYDDGN